MTFARLFIIPLLVMLLLAGCKRPPVTQPTALPLKRPNIVIIMADDMGYSDLGCYGSEINTPNIDRLAANGMRMTQFYNTSRCCPTRAALLTGVYQHEAGVGFMTGNDGTPAYQGFLNRQTATIAELLRANGYTTLMSGKWHVGSRPQHWPTKRGFDRFYGIPEGGGVYFYPFQKPRSVVLDEAEIAVDTFYYSTDAINDYAVRFLEEQKGSLKPFFLYVAHIAPHFPLQAFPEDVARYRGKYLEGYAAIRRQRFESMKLKGILPSDAELSPPDDLIQEWNSLTEGQKDTADLKMAIYAAQIERMDMGIGDIVDKLKEIGEYDNTVIIFLSDNGASPEVTVEGEALSGPIGSVNSYASVGRAWANVSNTPFRYYKHWVHEGGISTPFILQYPALLRAATIERRVGHVMDLMPTCLDLGRSLYPAAYQGDTLEPLKGKSLMPLLRQQPIERQQPLFWEHRGNRAVRLGDWKLVSRHTEGRDEWELYNIAEDRAELHNRAEAQPDQVREMAAMYAQWAEEVGVLPIE
jgi:arylsulfatase